MELELNKFIYLTVLCYNFGKYIFSCHFFFFFYFRFKIKFSNPDHYVFGLKNFNLNLKKNKNSERLNVPHDKKYFEFCKEYYSNHYLKKNIFKQALKIYLLLSD